MKRRNFIKYIIAAPFAFIAGAVGVVVYISDGAGDGKWHHVLHDPRTGITSYDDVSWLDLSVKANRQLALDAAQIIEESGIYITDVWI